MLKTINKYLNTSIIVAVLFLIMICYNWVTSFIETNKINNISDFVYGNTQINHMNKGILVEDTEYIYYSVKDYIVEQYDLNLNLLATYTSYQEAAARTNINKKLIIVNCIGKSKTCKGYIFKKKIKEESK